MKTNYVRHLFQDMANNTYKNNNNDGKGEDTTTKSTLRESGV